MIQMQICIDSRGNAEQRNATKSRTRPKLYFECDICDLFSTQLAKFIVMGYIYAHIGYTDG